MALIYLHYGNAKGIRNMVALRNKYRMVIESIGEEQDLNQKAANQSFTVFANKWFTNEQANVQQLRDGLTNFFAALIEVLDDGQDSELMVEDKVTPRDFLRGAYLGTREAQAEKDRESVAITAWDVSAHAVARLIARFKGAVGFYISFIDSNPYHQPGVKLEKKAAQKVINIKRKFLKRLSEKLNKLFTINEISQLIHYKYDIEVVNKVIRHLTANKNRRITKVKGRSFLDAKFGLN